MRGNWRKAAGAAALVAALTVTGCGDDGTPEDAGPADAVTMDTGGPTDGGPDTAVDDTGVDAPAPDAGCPSGETLCDGTCTDTDVDPEHCGDCMTACGVGESCTGGSCTGETPATEDELIVEDVATDLEVIWEIRFLPDGNMLITERPGRISRVSPSDGSVTMLGTLDVASVGESGLMGMALDPDFATNSYIYVCYTYDDAGSLKNRISRLTYSDSSVGDEMTLVEGIQGAMIHDGCRIGFGPDDHKLYVTMGDASDGSRAQDMSSLNGKVLRMNTDGSVPDDNPFAGSLVYTMGHRNPQGLDWHSSGVAFVSEHGPSTDDEVNRLIAGRNYGWPDHRGAPGVDGFEDAIYDWTPTIAPSGAVFYYRSEIRGWRGSWVMLTLASADIRRLTPANADFTEVASEDILFDHMYGRLRALRVGPDGFLYVGTSNRDGRGAPDPDDDKILRIRM